MPAADSDQRSPPQFSLLRMLMVMTVCAVLAAAVRAAGGRAFFVALVLMLVVWVTLNMIQLIGQGSFRNPDDNGLS